MDITRRRFIVGVGGGSVATGVLGSGAFSNVSASRSVSVAVADDYDAYLTLTQRGTGNRSYHDGPASTVRFDIPSSDDKDYGGTDPQGAGTDSVYRFGQDAAGDEAGLFGIENQGTQPVEIYSTQSETAGVPSITIYDVETGDLLTEDDPSEPLDVGDSPLLCGLEIDTSGVDVRDEEYDVTVTINATAENLES